MANTDGIQVTVTVKRGDQAHTYALTPAGESRKGTFAVFSPAPDCPDIPSFAKLYVNLPKTASAHAKTRKSKRADAKKHAGTAAAGTPQTATITLADVQKLIAASMATALKGKK